VNISPSKRPAHLDAISPILSIISIISLTTISVDRIVRDDPIALDVQTVLAADNVLSILPRSVQHFALNGRLVNDSLATSKENKLANVLKERMRENRQAKLNMKDNQQDANEASKDTHFDKFPGIGDDRGKEEQWVCLLEDFLTEGDILENRLIGKPAESFKELPTNEQGLITVDDSASDTTEIIQEGDTSEPPVVPRKLVHESTGLDLGICFQLAQPLHGAGGQKSVGVKKQ
jgi:hypothetical protein